MKKNYAAPAQQQQQQHKMAAPVSRLIH